MADVSDQPERWSQATVYADMWVDPGEDPRDNAGASPDGELATLRDYLTNYRLTLLMSASGRVYLAFCQPEQRDTLLDILSRSTREEDRLARSPEELEKILEEAREQGYATAVRSRRVSEEVAMSVPVLVDDRVLATLAVRFSASAVPLGLAVERFIPKLQETANTIRERFGAAQGSAT